MSQASITNPRAPSITDRLKGVRILIVAPSLAIMGGQAVQADLLITHLRGEGVSVTYQPQNPKPWWPLHYLCGIKYLRTLVVSIFYLCGLCLRVPRHDVIHIFSASYASFFLAPAPAIMLAKLFGKRCILNYRSGEADDHLTKSGRRIAWIIRMADKIVVPSGYLVDVFLKHGFRASFIYNISDFDTFRYRCRDTITPKILVARNLDANYDVETSIRAFALLKRNCPKATLTILGAGPDERKLKNLVKIEGIDDVTFAGRIERNRIGGFFDQSDIFLNSSIVDNMPVAIIEAFYSGLPVVTTNAGGIPYIVRDRENGLLVPARDAGALAAALTEVCESPILRAKLVAGGRVDALKFSWAEVKHHWAETYFELSRQNEQA